MLDRDALERLEGFIATAKQPGDLPWALIESDVANWLAANGDELLRVYRAWLDAPVVEVQEIGDIDDTPTVIATGTRDELRKGTSLVYKQARLVSNSAIERGQDDAT